MKILIMTKNNGDDGVTSHVINLANELHRIGHKVIVAAPYTVNREIGRYAKLDCTFIQVEFDSLNIIYTAWKIKQILEKYQIEIIHSHNRCTSVYAKWICVGRKVPFIWTMHINNIPSGFFYKLLTFTGDRTIVVSKELKEYCVSKLGVRQDNVSVISNGIAEKMYTPYNEEKKIEIKKNWNIKPNEKVISILANLEERKGQLLLLKALKKLDINYTYKVILAGALHDNGCYRKKLIDYARKFELIDHIIFPGYVNPIDLLNVSDLIVLPSENEGQPIAVIEAFIMKVPVIRTKTGGYEEQKDFCIGIDVGNDIQLARELEKFFKEGFGDGMVENAYNFAIKNCTDKVMAERTVEVYCKALERRMI